MKIYNRIIICVVVTLLFCCTTATADVCDNHCNGVCENLAKSIWDIPVVEVYSKNNTIETIAVNEAKKNS